MQAQAVPALAAQPLAKKDDAASVPDWMKDLMPSSAPARPVTTTTQVEIPLNLIGLLTADCEAPVRRIEAASGAFLQIRQDMQHFGYSLVIMTGKPDSLAKATEMVKQQVGLSGGHVTKEIETTADHRSAHSALELALEDLRKRKAGDVPLRIQPPGVPGGKLRVIIGPAPVFLVSMAEQLIRKKLSDKELDLCWKQGRPVPIEMKVAVLCKFWEAGQCSSGGCCSYSHGTQELAMAQRAHMPEGAENARGNDSATLVANLPRWPPAPGDIGALAPLQDSGFPRVAEAPARELQASSGTSGMI